MREGVARLSQRRLFAVLVATLFLGLMASGAMVWRGSEAVFSANTSNGGNTWTSGTLSLADNDASAVLFAATNMVPGKTETKCITVRYTGNVAATVKLYAANPSDSGLASEIDLVVDAGTTEPTDDSGYGTNCTAGYGWSNVFNGTLAAFNTTKLGFSSGVGAWTPSVNPTRRVFRIAYTFRATSAEQDKSAGTTFQWEAQS
jgi:hypothetical protein